ncbi:MAG: type IV secretion system protein TraC [Verrucomicrobia bacterium]|nr:type IV secretion system protein TraC [Verrucomicrobiota bacterium]
MKAFVESTQKFLNEFKTVSLSNPGNDNYFPQFCGLLPYRVYDELDKLYLNEDSYGFILEASTLSGASQETVEILSGMITEGIPEGCAIQIINWASPSIKHIFDHWQEPRFATGGIYKKLAEKRIEYYQKANWESLFKNPFLIRDFRVFIAVSVPAKFAARGKQVLQGLKEQLNVTLKNINIPSREMLPNELLSLLEELVNPSLALERPEMIWNKMSTLSEHLNNPERTLQVQPDGLTFTEEGHEHEIRCYSVRSFPEVWAQWQNQDLIGDFYSDYSRLPCPFITVFSFIYGNEERGGDWAQYKLLRATQASASGLGRFVPSVGEREKDWRFVADNISKGQKLVQAFYQVILYSKKEEIEQNERYLLSLYKAKGWRLVKDKYAQLQSFLAALPFTYSEGLDSELKRFGKLKTMVTWSCANLSPLQGEWKGQGTPRLMLLGRRGQPLFWDPFTSGGNYNIAVIGQSGSGKSVYMQELVSSLRGAGGQVVVIDDGRSFMNSCLLQGGEFVEFSHDSKICLNPFSIVQADILEKRADYKEEVMQQLNLIIRQMCRSEEKTSSVENALIGEAIKCVWEQHKSAATITHVSQWLLSHKDVRAKDLGMMLAPYTASGLYARFFEGQANISLNSPFFVFEFDRIKSKPELQRIVLMTLIFLVSEKMFHGDRKRTISLVIDEAWSLLDGHSFADFIGGIARRARKYNGQLITGTQSIDDYYKNPAATAAIQNTDWFCLLAQKQEAIESMKKSDRIVLTHAMEKALVSLRMVNHQYSEVMIYGSSIGYAVGRLVLDPYSIALYSSKGEDFSKVQALKEQGMPLEDAIEVVAQNIQRGNK